jgi:uncharacterized protein YaiL (DUF2058 family)
MSDSLREQLLKAGLVSQKQAKQASQQQRKPSRHQPAPVAEPTLAARQAQAAKAARDQELNRQQKARAEAKARNAALRQLIEQNCLPRIEGDDFYNFVHGTKVRRIAVNARLREQLGRGEIVIVGCEGRYDLVPATVATRICERDPGAVVPPNVAQDDGVPDDLVW